MSITDNYHRTREDIPDNVTLLLAAKTRTVRELEEAFEAGATDIGQNYVQEAVIMHEALGDMTRDVNWHMIGPLQKNKINKALSVFDVIQTVDSLDTAIAIDKRVVAAGKSIIPVYIEINIGNEDSKAGIAPEQHEPFEEYMERLVREISGLGNLRLEGLMTMGPRFGNPEDSRPFFRRTKAIYEHVKALDLPHVDMKCLSMGMTNSYRVAIEEGATMVRIGTAVFGGRGEKTATTQDVWLV